MSVKTETLDILTGDGSSPNDASVGVVLLYAPTPGAVAPAFVLGDTPLVFGREPPRGGIPLPFTSVSRVHTRIARKGAEVVVADLDSRNGTFVNGARVRQAFVEHGDEVRIGECLFKIVLRDAERYVACPLEGTTPAPPLQELRGGSALDRVRREILRTAPTNLSVLVLGETGAGKELAARALHEASGRSGPLATVNCAAIPATLLESELFGYKRGAFTGADRDRVGIVKSADGGTLFLDEIGDMPLDAQAKVLRMIETRTVAPLGSHVAEPVDVRIVSATHRPLAHFVRDERFRADLYARISGHTVELPPLRDRKEDLYQLTRLFLERAGGSGLKLTPSFAIGLFSYDWPFNVRELDTVIRRAVALSDGTLDESHLPPAVVEAIRDRAGAKRAPEDPKTGGTPTEAALRALLIRHNGNIAAVARELERDRVQIHRWLKRYELSIDDFRKP